MKVLNYRILLRKEPEGGYTVLVPSLPGCVTYGDSIKESIKMAKEAIELYLESLKEHGNATLIMEEIQKFHLLLPWPILYELLRTRFIKKKIWVQQFRKSLRTLNIEYINDDIYREKALYNTLEQDSSSGRNISLVDMIIRNILQDRNLRIEFIF